MWGHLLSRISTWKTRAALRLSSHRPYSTSPRAKSTPTRSTQKQLCPAWHKSVASLPSFRSFGSPSSSYTVTSLRHTSKRICRWKTRERTTWRINLHNLRADTALRGLRSSLRQWRRCKRAMKRCGRSWRGSRRARLNEESRQIVAWIGFLH